MSEDNGITFAKDDPKRIVDDFENSGIDFEEDNPRRSVYDLENSLDGYGRTIYVEEWEEITGKPKSWYRFNKQGVLMKSVRRSGGIFKSYLGKTRYLS